MSHSSYVLAVHGGAGTIAPGNDASEGPYREGLRAALAAGQAVLQAGGSALDAAVAAVAALEDHPLFNAGHGAVFNAEGEHELDASVMDGTSLRAGAVAAVRTLRNPVRGALAVLREGRSVLLAAQGAERFAREHGLAQVDAGYFSTPARLAQLRAVQASDGQAMVLDHDGAAQTAGDSRRFGTVGAVALDRDGHLAAATSTGGMTNKRPGRIGDTALIGSGCYANDATCAVSATGSGEHFIRACVAHDVHARIAYAGQPLADAARDAIVKGLAPLGGHGGIIALDRHGNLAMPYNSRGMYRGWVREQDDALATAIFDA